MKILIFSLFAICTALADETENASSKPNLVIFFADDLKANCLGFLGHPYVKTPNLDALFKDGFIFRNTYNFGADVQAVCAPSRAMLITGRTYFRKTRSTLTLIEVLKGAGYLTARSGKFGNSPGKLEGAADMNLDGRTAKGDADNLVAFVVKHAGEKPLFLYMCSPEPHDPQYAPKEFYSMYRAADIPLPQNFQPFHPFDNGEMTVRDEKTLPWPRTRESVTGKLAKYYASISFWDSQVGRVIESLKAAGQFENTIFVVAADNGLSLGDHGLLGKQNLYEFGGMHVPLAFAGKGIPKGESKALAYVFEIYPTLCDLAGITPPEGLDALSLAPLIEGKKDRIRDLLVTSYRDCQRSVRDSRWKLIRYPQINKTQLFDLESDPYEITDLSEQPENAAKIEELTTKMQEALKSYGDTLPLSVENPKPAAWSPDLVVEKKL